MDKDRWRCSDEREVFRLGKKIQDVAPYAYYVHCASHNLNLVLKDAIKAVTETHQFYDTIESVYNLFEHSIVRWQKLQNVHDRYCSNPTLKALNSTRWSGRYDAVYALNEKFCNVMKCLTYIILTSTKPKERDEAMAIKKQIKTLSLYPCWLCNARFCSSSKPMQCKTNP